MKCNSLKLFIQIQNNNDFFFLGGGGDDQYVLFIQKSCLIIKLIHHSHIFEKQKYVVNRVVQNTYTRRELLLLKPRPRAGFIGDAYLFTSTVDHTLKSFSSEKKKNKVIGVSKEI